MQEETLIHIGYPKTGTTWLQNEFFAKNRHVFHLLSRNVSGPCSLGDDFIRTREGAPLTAFDFNEQTINDELIELKQSMTGQVNVISHEGLVGGLNWGSYNSLPIGNRLKNIFPKAKILIVVRKQEELILSSYFQSLVAGSTLSLTQYLRESYLKPGFNFMQFDFTLIVDWYYKNWGKDNVLVLPYEMFASDSGMFLKMIGEFIGVERELQLRNSNPINETKNYCARYVLRRFNALTFFFSDSVRMMVYLKIIRLGRFFIPRIFDTLFARRLAKIISKRVEKRYEASNTNLSQLIGIDLAQYGYHD